MCLIVRGRVRDLFSLDLEYAEICNADGFGIHTSDSVFSSFDFPDTDSRTILEALPLDTVATIHYRLATHGTVNNANCHPFSLGDGVFLMHNGVLRGDGYVCPVGKRSDTAILAASLAMKSHRQRCYALNELAISNRFCLLQGNRWKKFGNWHYCPRSKTWHSNRLIMPSTKVRDTRYCNPLAWRDDTASYDDYYYSGWDWKTRRF